MAIDPSPLEVVADPSATDPLSEVTRQERKALLGACVIAVSIAAGGLVPEKIEALGITVTPAQERSLLYLLAGVITYFVVGFAIYAASDLNRRRVATAQARGRIAPVVDEAMRDYKVAEERWKEAKDTEHLLADERFKRVAALSDQIRLAQRVSSFGTLRILFDVWLPLVIGIASAAVVLAKTRGFPGWPWVTAIGGSTTAVILAVFLWKRRKVMTRSWSRQRGKWRSWRFKRLMAAANRIPDGDAKKARLLSKARDSLMKSLEEFAPDKKSDRAQLRGSSGRPRRGEP